MPEHALRPTPRRDSCSECGHDKFIAELSVTYTAKPNTDWNTFDLYHAEDLVAFQSLSCAECHHGLTKNGEVVDPDALNG